MSRESKDANSKTLAKKILHAALPWFKPASKPAHPWTAHRPATYLAGAAPAGIIIATKAHTLLTPPVLPIEALPSPASEVEKVALAIAAAAPKRQVEEAAPIELAPIKPAAIELTPVELAPTGMTAASAVPSLVLVPEAKSVDGSVAEDAGVLPGIAAHTGRDFQLAARLRSVATLNRRSDLTGEIEAKAQTSVRRSKVEPPAVLTKKRRKQTGQVVHLATRRAQGTRIQLRTAA